MNLLSDFSVPRNVLCWKDNKILILKDSKSVGEGETYAYGKGNRDGSVVDAVLCTPVSTFLYRWTYFPCCWKSQSIRGMPRIKRIILLKVT